MASTNHILTYRQTGQVKLKCSINLDRLFPDKSERERFDSKFKDFIKSEKANRSLFQKIGNKLSYDSEQLIPTKVNSKPPLLLVLGNPASHSVKNGMFFSFEGDSKEHRFWKNILKPAGMLDLDRNEGLTNSQLNRQRKKQLLELTYQSPFR